MPTRDRISAKGRFSFGLFFPSNRLPQTNKMANRKSKLSFLLLHAALLATVLAASLADAATLSLAAKNEIESLLSRLEASGCQFYRNGSWHSSGAAQAHLVRKLDYLVGKGAVASAEQFIERAATESSITGRAYLVKCGSSPSVQSGAWLLSQLRAIRATSAAPASSPK
jgi:hypothetical protein